ncbi:helix-turn-helix transcriptional regulator [Paenibacillus sp. CMAA1364]
MNRLIYIDFQDTPILAKLGEEAEPSYRGYFHYHQGIEFLYVHEGEGSIILEQTVHSLKPGTLFLFQPYQLHYVKAATESATYVRSIIHFEPNAVMSMIHAFGSLTAGLKHIWKDRLAAQVIPGFGDRHPIESLVEDYKRLLTGATPEGYQSLCIALLVQMLAFLEGENTFPPDKSSFMSRSTTHAEAIMEWIEISYNQPFKLDKLASELHLSKYHVSHLFREETGHSITEYLLARRVQESCKLLATTNISVEAIGARVGWPIPSHFSSQFRKYAGCTPKQYRNKQALLLPAKDDMSI